MSIQKKIKRILTLLLCTALLLGIVPPAATADELPTVKESAGLSAAADSSEVLSRREENIKHFDMGDGTYQAIVYSHPVHELDEDGNWQDIDFSLSLTGTRGDQKYVNKAAGVAFADQYETGKPVMSLSKDGNAIDMTLLSISSNKENQRTASAPIAAEVKNPEGEMRTMEEANQAVFSSSVIYEDVVPGVDLEYIVDPGLIKENIIVKEPSDAYRYTFSLNLTGMYPVLQENGSIYLFDKEKDEKTYIIPAPYMYDAAGYESEAVEYTLLGSGNAYSLTVTADAAWINAEDRSFPVTIDPSVVSVGAFAMEDTYTNSEDEDGNFGSRIVLWIRSTRTTYIKFNELELPANAEITNATLNCFYYYYEGVSKGVTKISAHKIIDEWDECSLTWNGAEGLDGNNGLASPKLSSSVAYANKGAVKSDPEPIFFNVTEAVQDWVDNPDDNHGIGLKFIEGSTNQSVILKSRETNAQHRPYLVCRYTEGSGNTSGGEDTGEGENTGGNEGTEEIEYAAEFEYINYYDSTMADRDGLIDDAVQLADIAFKRQFNIAFCTDSQPVQKNDLTSCRIADENGGECNCEDISGGKHHKDTVWISDKLNDIYDNMTSNNVKSKQTRIVLWTDYPVGTYCKGNSYGTCVPEDEENSLSGGKIAVVRDCRPAIHFMNLVPDNANSDQYLACMALNLIHETAHTFGLKEQDKSEASQRCDGRDVVGMQCVMESYPSVDDIDNATTFYQYILAGGTAFCNGCKDNLEALLQGQNIIP